MLRHSGYFVCACLLAVHFSNVLAAGTFELKIRQFENQLGIDSQGRCCNNPSRRPTARDRRGCSSVVDGDEPSVGCLTKLRVCLMHYQSVVDDNPECTYGEVVTSVLGTDSIDVLRSDNVTNPLRFPFTFAWPMTFSLMIEAWHQLPGYKPGDDFTAGHQLIYRVTKQGYVDAGNEWRRDERRSNDHAVLFDYRLTCDHQYYGRKCNVFCKSSANSTFGHYTCREDGSRQCLSGWTGDYCTKAVCLPGCHEEHGFCDHPNECKCQPGWTGEFCDQCQRYPNCQRGTCSHAWGCDCLEGWGGLFCNQDLNFCTNHRPCKNGGTCFNTGEGSYTCRCPLGFNGTDCEIEEGGCARHPCLHGGICRDTSHNYTCACPRGWTGHRCETAAESCSDRPCQNGGSCFDELLGYRCECAAGFRGTNCERRATVCQPDTCANGGSCVNVGESFRCMCPAGFTGRRCDVNIDDCANQPCLHGGTCIDQVNAFHCECRAGFVGSVCHINVNDCKTRPCANGGRCHDGINDFTCTCRPGFIGKDCSVNVDECVGQTCLNGGTCVDRVAGFECRCADGFVGELCQFEGVVPAWARSVMVASSHASASSPFSTRATGDVAPMPTRHVVLVATLSVTVPALVLVSIATILCAKYRRRRAAEKADRQARIENEQNACCSVSSGGSGVSAYGKRNFEEHMIVNALDYPTVGGGGKLKNVDDSTAADAYMQRAKSTKQINVDSCRAMLNCSSSSTAGSVSYDKLDGLGSGYSGGAGGAVGMGACFNELGSCRQLLDSAGSHKTLSSACADNLLVACPSSVASAAAATHSLRPPAVNGSVSSSANLCRTPADESLYATEV